MTTIPTNFTWIDWLLIGLYLSLSVLVGLWANRYAGNMVSFLGAGRHVGTWLGIATMTGTEMGLITVMYNAQKGFKGGFAAFHIAVLAGLVTFLVGLTGFIVVPLRKHRVLTIPEFYEMRFGRRVRIVGGVILASAGILNMGMFLKVGSMFVVGVTGLADHSAALVIVMTFLLALVLVYTILGGMISVILTDYIQFVVLSLGLLLTTLYAIWDLGWTPLFQTVQQELGPAGFDPFEETGFGMEYVYWMALMGLVSCAVWPTAVSRALAMESPQAVRRQFMWSSLSFAVRFLIPCFWGICALVFMSRHTELATLVAAKASGGLYEMPVFLAQLLPTGILGIVTAAMLAAFMSTHDSYLLCWSSVITQDVVAPLGNRQWSDRQRITLTRWFILLIGIFVWAWGLFYRGNDDIWDYMAITGAIYFTGSLPILVGGLYWSRASATGAMASLLCGSSALLGLEPLRSPLNQQLAQWLHQPTGPDAVPLLSSQRVGLLTVVLTALVFVLVSLAFPDKRPTTPHTSTGEQP